MWRSGWRSSSRSGTTAKGGRRLVRPPFCVSRSHGIRGIMRAIGMHIVRLTCQLGESKCWFSPSIASQFSTESGVLLNHLANTSWWGRPCNPLCLLCDSTLLSDRARLHAPDVDRVAVPVRPRLHNPGVSYSNRLTYWHPHSMRRRAHQVELEHATTALPCFLKNGPHSLSQLNLARSLAVSLKPQPRANARDQHPGRAGVARESARLQPSG